MSDLNMKTSMNSKPKFITTLLASGVLATLAGCSTVPHKAEIETTSSARVAATPNSAPHRTITNFTESLRCMDAKLAKYEVSNLLLGTQEVNDPTSEVAGTKDMLLTALSTMSRRSKAFSVVTMSSDLGDITAFHTYHATKKFQAPDFFIRLSAPQIDKGVQVNQKGGGLRIKGVASAEHSRDRIASILSLDMNLGLVRNLQLLPGIYSSNSIAVIRKGQSTDVSGEIRKMGALFSVTSDSSEGFHHSVRTLIELGAIELVGRLTQIPYWECLDISATNPSVQAQIQDWYDGLNQNELRMFVQSKLYALDYYKGAVDGKDSEKLKKAILSYKVAEGSVASHRMDYMLYYKLMIDPTPVAIQHLPLLKRNQNNAEMNANQTHDDFGNAVRIKVEQHTQLESTGVPALDFIFVSDKGSEPVVYKSGDIVNLSVTPSMDAHVYCYYQQGDGQIYKIFPNRFRPNSLIAANTTLLVPGSDKFTIQADRTGYAENVMCMASYTDIEKELPFPLREKDLQPLPVGDLGQIFALYKNSADVTPLRKSIRIEVQ